MLFFRSKHRYLKRIYYAVLTGKSYLPHTRFVHSQPVHCVSEMSSSQALTWPSWAMLLCVYLHPYLSQTFFRAFIRRGEKSWIHFSSLWLSTQYCSTPSPSPFPLSGCRTLKLQKPFVPGPLRGEATLHLYWSAWPSTGTVGNSVLSRL